MVWLNIINTKVGVCKIHASIINTKVGVCKVHASCMFCHKQLSIFQISFDCLAHLIVFYCIPLAFVLCILHGDGGGDGIEEG